MNSKVKVTKDSRFIKGKDPIRNPLTQEHIENNFIENYQKTLKVMKSDITKILKK